MKHPPVSNRVRTVVTVLAVVAIALAVTAYFQSQNRNQVPVRQHQDIR